MARRLVDRKSITHEEWLALRKKSIGGSDAGAIMGASTWAGPVTVYADKMGLKEDRETSEAMRLGTDLESYVAERFTEETGKKVRRDNYMYMHDDYDFITANIDRVVVGENAGLECKTMGGFAANYDFEAGEVPANYYCQCQHYMMVMGYDRMYLCILVLQKGVYVIPVDYDEKYAQGLLDAEVSFWQTYIEKKQMPPPATQADRDTVSEMYPQEKDRDNEVYLTGLDAIGAEIDKHTEVIALHKEQVESLKAKVQMSLGDTGRGYGDKYKVSWLSQDRTTIDTKKLKEKYPLVYNEVAKKSTSRPLRITKRKEKKNGSKES